MLIILGPNVSVPINGL